jgi:uncharacterized protein
MYYKPSYYFQIFEGDEQEKAVAINTITGGTYSFDKSALAKVRQALVAPDETSDPEIRAFLISERILVPENFDELENLKGLHRIGRHSKKSLYATYSMTNACNFRCSYCYQSHSRDVLAAENLDKTFAYINNMLPEYDELKVHWFGGEPLLRLRWIEIASKELRTICDKFGKIYYAAITTNGSLFQRDTALLLKNLGVKQIQFTLDGEEAVHNSLRLKKNGTGSYNEVMNAISIAIEEKFTIFLRINLSLKSTHNLKALLMDFKNRGWSSNDFMIYLNEMKQHSNSLNMSDIYFKSVADYSTYLIDCLKLLKEFGYPIPRLKPVDVNCAFDKPSSVLFGTDGNLYHCTTGTDRALGIINDEGLIVEESERRKAIHSREPWDDPHCAKCTSLPMCMGGCAYLDEEGKTKCNPEGFVIEQLLRLNLPETVERNHGD